MPRLTFLCCLPLLLSGATATADVGNDNFETVRTIAQPVHRKAPVYPRNELRKGQQGWVDLSFVVTVDGKVVDPIVVDSSGSAAFERAAKRAVQKFTYEPATVNGQAVQQCETRARIGFALSDSQDRVSRNFHRRFMKVLEVLDSGDLDATSTLLDAEFEADHLTLSEIAWLWTLRARVAGATGDKDARLTAVRRATSSPTWVEDHLYRDLMTVRTTMEIESGLYADALQSFELLKKTGADNENTQILARAVEQIQDAVNDDSILSVPANIEARPECDDCRANWQYEPLRRRFRLDNISGNLDTLEVRCRWKRYVDTIDADQTWDLPDDWGDCSIVIFGEPGASFELHEMPSA